MSEPPVVELMFSPGESVIAISLSPVGEGVPESSVIEFMLASGGDVIVTWTTAYATVVCPNVTGRTTERKAQSKRVRARSLAT